VFVESFLDRAIRLAGYVATSYDPTASIASPGSKSVVFQPHQFPRHGLESLSQLFCIEHSSVRMNAYYVDGNYTILALNMPTCEDNRWLLKLIDDAWEHHDRIKRLMDLSVGDERVALEKALEEAIGIASGLRIKQHEHTKTCLICCRFQGTEPTFPDGQKAEN
jgi:hypothetical protein